MAKWIGIVSMVIGTVGIFFGFYYLGENVPYALKIVTLATVGIVGVLSFVRHVIFYKSDAKRLGWETDRPDWMFEVGFANLAFGFMGFLSLAAPWGPAGQALVLLGYAVYLLQAGLLHGYRYFTDEKRVPARLWRSAITTLIYAGMLSYFAVYALNAARG